MVEIIETANDTSARRKRHEQHRDVDAPSAGRVRCAGPKPKKLIGRSGPQGWTSGERGTRDRMKELTVLTGIVKGSNRVTAR